MRPSPRNPLGRPAGFTLIEVLVSLAIFALAAVVLSAAYLNVLSSYQAAARRQRGEEDWKLVRAAVVAEADRAVVEQGGFLPLPDQRRLRWTATIEPTEVADLFAVTLEAELERATEAEAWTRSERVMLLRPAWSDASERAQLRAATKARLEESRPQP
jgi:general secretion pathway protein I